MKNGKKNKKTRVIGKKTIDSFKSRLKIIQKLNSVCADYFVIGGVAANFHIAQGRADVPELMQGADILVHPAHHEMAGHVILEAMASGLPVLPNAVCGYAFHVQQAQAGRLVPAPFLQHEFNRLLLEMLTSAKLEMWRENGIRYTKDMMKANDGGAEATILTKLAERKRAAHVL